MRGKGYEMEGDHLMGWKGCLNLDMEENPS